MVEFEFSFDIDKVKFEERFINDELETVTLYFIVPKEWLGDLFPEAVHATISVEYPIAHPEASYASVMISPTKEDADGGFKDYEWCDLTALPEEIEALIILAEKEENVDAMAKEEKAQANR